MNPRRILWVVVLLLGATASAQATEVVVYYHTDALHSATTLTNAQGQVIERTHYAPYGQVLNRALRDGPGYAGHEEDAATGLVYMQQRYYDPESGTFLSADPVEANAGAGFNRYAYAANNPYRNIDPDGRQFSVPDCGANGCFPAGTKGSTGTMMGIVADANMAVAEAVDTNMAMLAVGGPQNTQLSTRPAGQCDLPECDEVRQTRARIVRNWGNGLEDAGLFAGKFAIFNFVGDGIGRLFGKLGKLSKLLGLAREEVSFGRNANQIYHTFRHVRAAGLEEEAVQQAIEKDLRSSASLIQTGKSLNQTITVGGREVRYSAYRLQDGSINVGRITTDGQ